MLKDGMNIMILLLLFLAITQFSNADELFDVRKHLATVTRSIWSLIYIELGFYISASALNFQFLIAKFGVYLSLLLAFPFTILLHILLAGMLIRRTYLRILLYLLKFQINVHQFIWIWWWVCFPEPILIKNWQIDKIFMLLRERKFGSNNILTDAYTLRSELSQLVLISWYIYLGYPDVYVFRFSLGRAIHRILVPGEACLHHTILKEENFVLFKWEITVYFKTEVENTIQKFSLLANVLEFSTKNFRWRESLIFTHYTVLFSFSESKVKFCRTFMVVFFI